MNHTRRQFLTISPFAGLTLLKPKPTQPPTLPVFYPESFGAVADATTDDTASIQAAINAAGVHGGKVILSQHYAISARGVHTFNAYRRDYALIVPYSNVHLYGPGHLLFNRPPITQTGRLIALAVGSGNNPTTNTGLHGLTIKDTADLSGEMLDGAAVAFLNCDGFVVEHCRVNTNWGDNIGINAAIHSRNGHILNNRVTNIPKSGLWFDGLIDSLIAGNDVKNVGLHGIAAVPNTDYFQAGGNNLIVNNHINQFGHTGIALDGGNTHTIIANNQIHTENESSVTGIHINSSSNQNGNWESRDNLITGNLITGKNLGVSMAFSLRGTDAGAFDGGPVLCHRNIFTGNYVAPNGFVYAAYFRQAVQHNIIVNNILSGRSMVIQTGVTTAINNVTEPNY